MKRKYRIVSSDCLNYRLVDNNEGVGKRLLKLKSEKYDTRWSEGFRGVEIMRLVDHGNGLTVIHGADEFELPYDVAGELYWLLKHLDEDSPSPGYFGKVTKTEKT